MRFDQSIRFDHAAKVFRPSKARDLQENRFVTGDVEGVQRLRDLFRFQLTVFLTQRIDGRIDKKLRNRQGLGKLRKRENGGVILNNVRAKEGPRLSLRP